MGKIQTRNAVFLVLVVERILREGIGASAAEAAKNLIRVG